MEQVFILPDVEYLGYLDMHNTSLFDLCLFVTMNTEISTIISMLKDEWTRVAAL